MKELKSIVAQMKTLVQKAEGMMGGKKPMKKVQRPMPVTHPLPKDTKKQGESTMGSQVRTSDNLKQHGFPGAASSSMTGAKDTAKQSLADTKAMPKPSLPKAEGKKDEEEQENIVEGQANPEQDQIAPDEDIQVSPEAGTEAEGRPGEEVPPHEGEDLDDDGVADEDEEHGPIDPATADANRDGEVTPDEADMAAGDGYVYIAGDGDSIGQQVGQAMLHDDVEGLQGISGKINQGQDMFAQWLETAGGEMISAGGDEFVGRVPAGTDLSSLEQMRSDYASAVGATVTVGTGNSMSQAGKALIYGKLNGKDQTAPYDQSMEEFLRQIHEGYSGEESEEDKEDEHYLSSVYDDQGAQPSSIEDQVSQQPPMPGGEDPSRSGMPPQGEGEAAVDQVAAGRVPVEEQEMDEPIGKDDASPAEGEMPPMDGQQGTDGVIEATMASGMQGGDGSYLKSQMMNVLDGFKKDKEFIESMQSGDPETYHEIIGLLHQMIKVARMLNSSGEASQHVAPGQESAQSKSGLEDALDAADDDQAAPPVDAGSVPSVDESAPPAESDEPSFPPKKGGFPSKKDEDKKDKAPDKSDKKPEDKKDE